MSVAHASPLPNASRLLWTARLLTVAILGFWGLFLVASLTGDAAASSRPLHAGDYVSLSLLVASLAGLGLALKWERAGATLTLIAVILGAIVNWRVLVFPGTLIPITAGLFLVHAALRRRRRPVTE
jgi:hypothetical protein